MLQRLKMIRKMRSWDRRHSSRMETRRRKQNLNTRRGLALEVLEERKLMAFMPGANLSTGTHLTTYTLALATTAEFTQAAGGKAATQTLLSQFVGEINKIFGSELATSFQLHPQNDRLIFENAVTDGYTNGSSAMMFGENPVVINNALNGNPTIDAGYDLGHVLGIGTDGGLAGIGEKASGVSNLRQADASARNVSLLGHEIGHQLNASHTLNGKESNCASNRNAETAMEPGSGSTIMAYQGNCAGDNLAEFPGDGNYFHAVSFDEIIDYATNVISGLGSRTLTGNTLPMVNAGPDRTIPASTPFSLASTASDPDAGDRLTFTWDQTDLSTAAISVPIPAALDNTGPLFRSFAPTTDPTRVFPRIQDIVTNTPSTQNKDEHLPTQNRVLNFRVTVRDNHSFNGKNVSGVTSDDIRLTVVNTGAPFRVTSFNGPNQPIAGGSQQTVTWNVAGTAANGINTTKVDILLSVDGGLTYPVKLASQTNNDGSEAVSIPNVSISKARIKVQADPAQNVFFDINDVDIQVNQDSNVTGGVVITESGGSTKVAEGLFVETGLADTDNYAIALTQPPTGPVTITVTSDDQTVVSVDGSSFANSRIITFASGDSAPKTITVKTVNDRASEGFHTGTIRHAVTASDDPNYSPALLTADVVSSIIAKISDDEAPPLIGIDLDFPPPNASIPVNWNGVGDPFSINLLNVTRENGDTTAVDFALSNGNATGAGWSDRTMNEATIPRHSPDLSVISDVMLWDDATLTATWSDLKSNNKYRVYIFAASEEVSDNDIPVKQTITITGSGADDPAPFLQDGTGKFTGEGENKTLHLLINGTVGNSANSLEQYGIVVTSTNDGKITINVTPVAGTPAIVSAFAIQEFFELTLPWQNPTNRFDVSGDGIVVPIDALRIINELNASKFRNAQGQLPDQRPTDGSFYDVNGDGFATTNDALQVINFLNTRSQVEGETTFVVVAPVRESRLLMDDVKDELASILDEIARDILAEWHFP